MPIKVRPLRLSYLHRWLAEELSDNSLLLPCIKRSVFGDILLDGMTGARIQWLIAESCERLARDNMGVEQIWDDLEPVGIIQALSGARLGIAYKIPVSDECER